jgi:hypothetical protein
MPRLLSPLLLSVLLAGSVVSGCSKPVEELATPVMSTAPSATAAPVDEPPGTIACGKAVSAVRDATVMNPGVVAGITTAAGTADAPVADVAQALSQAYTQAVAAHGTDDEPDAVAAVSAAAAELVRICGDSGLETAG